MEILEVDLDRFENGAPERRRAVVDGVMASLESGFVYLRHGFSEDWLDDVYGKLATFFSLDRETKATYNVAGSYGARGYTGTLVETAVGTEHADWKEMLNWGSGLPVGHPLRRAHPQRYLDPVLPERDVPGSSEALLTFHDAVARLQQRFLHVVADGLGVSGVFFDRLTADGNHLTRAIHYPPMETAPGSEHIWAAPHVDINLVTALPRATASGLQMLREDRWVDVVPPPGCAIINTGIMLEHLSNGRVAAGWHRVVSSGNAQRRYSVVQFLHPNPSAMLAPLPTCVDAAHPLAYPTVSAATALDAVLWDINLREGP